jgi:signal transduction histidine kinase
VRRRILGVLFPLLVVAVVLIGLQLGALYAQSQQRVLYLDRLNDTARLASVAEEALDAGDLNGLRAELVRFEEVFGVHSAVLDRAGTVLISAAGSVDLSDANARSQVNAAEAGVRGQEQGLLLPWDDRELAIAEPVSRNGDIVGVVITSSPTAELHREVLRGWALIAAIGAVALVGFGALIQWFTRWVLQPVRVLDDTAHHLASGRYDTRVASAGGPPELRRLARAFNEMADTVESSLEQQRMFVADASHQLRNPLHALLLRLQYLEMAGPAELGPELRGAEAEAWRLAGLVDQLLQLAKAEQPAGESESFALGALALERAEAIDALMRSKGVRLERPDPNQRDVLVRADRAAVSRALDELLDNALKYGRPRGTISVRVSRDGVSAVLSVTDDGPGLREGEWEQAARRFWRAPGRQNEPGVGLGLSIAHVLMDGAGGTLELRPGGGSGEARGLEARLVLPGITA